MFHRELPGGYREGTALFDECRYTLSLLRRLTGLLDLGAGYSEQEIQNSARSLNSLWDEHGFQSLVVIDCPELSEVLAEIDAWAARVVPLHSAPSGPLLHVVHAVRPVLRGHLEVVRSVRIAAIERSPAAAFFIENFDKSGDKLKRDNHNVGWHYHYCKANGDRSDTILCFDTNLCGAHRINSVPLFWERHAEGKAKFQAKAGLWGPKKRRSIWDRARPELARPFEEFRRPSEEALPVWPRAAVLSPRPQARSGR